MEKPRILAATDAGIAEAGAMLAAGGLVAFATETVYGLGADAANADAVARIYAAKGRPSFNPLIVHVPSVEAAREMAAFDGDAERLADAFWPGALTLVLPLRPEAGIASLVTAGNDTIAIRVPASETARALLVAAGKPIAAPSANPSGRISATTVEHVAQGLGDAVDAILDAGPSAIGVESTIVATGATPRLLRAGGLPTEIIEDCLGKPLTIAPDPERPEAPGQLASHYAPQATLRLNAARAEDGEILLGFGHVEADLNLSLSGDLVEAAARLFDCLHQLDGLKATNVAVSPIPETGLGRAINDRLRRAAAPR